MSVHLVGDNNANTLTADADDLFIWGEGGSDTLNGNGLNNKLGGGNGSEADTLNGGNGDDILLIQRGNDTLNGGANFDIARVADYERLDLVIVPIINVEKRAFETSDTVTQGVNITLGLNTTSMGVGNRQILDLDNGFSNFTGSNSFQDISASSVVTNRGNMTVSSIEQYELTRFGDNFFGNEQDDKILGLGGNDFIEGGAGADVVDGGDGIDTASYQRSNLGVGVVLDPALNATGLQSSGHAEGDRLISVENIVGSGFNDFIIGSADNNDLHGQSGNDTLTGRSGNDRVFGGEGNDKLEGDEGFDTLRGGDGDDSLNGGSGADVIDGGVGIDTASYAGLAGAVNATLLTNLGAFSLRATEHVGTTTATAVVIIGGVTSIDTFTSIENLIGSAFNDRLTGSDESGNRLEGRNGDDILSGMGGDDDLFGGANNDTLNGGIGLDELFGEDGVDTLNGDAGDDVLRGGAGADTLSGGSNIDTADYLDKALAVTITLNSAGAGTAFVNGIAEDTLTGIENLTGGSGKDVFIGNQGANVLKGSGGDDILQGGQGFDTLDGGANVDTADYSEKTQQVALQLNSAIGANSTVNGLLEDFVINIENIFGGSVGDILFGDANGNRIDGNGGGDKISGGVGADTLNGGGEKDEISGGDQIDLINGDSGDDRLFGDGDADVINGGTENDFLNGGLGKDTLNGGAGIDTADYSEKTVSVDVKLGGAAVVIVRVGGVDEDTVQEVENLIGGSAGDFLVGDNEVNRLIGGQGDDRFRGAGGLDFIDGGENIDTVNYTDDTLSVVATLNGAVETTVTVGGVAADIVVNVENIAGGTAGDFLTGDSLGNTLSGSNGDDTLDGGLGSDTLIGGTENDTYIVDNFFDEIIEFGGQGNADRVKAATSYSLGAGDEIEFLETIDAAATTAINLLGNELAQTITGNVAGNVLDGGVDTVRDVLIGLDGSDTYFIRSSNEVIVEGAGLGAADRVRAAVSYVLAAGVSVERMEAEDAAAASPINLTGNEFAQTIIGNAGTNILNGGNDLLIDVLVGGLDNDIYVINSANDLITEFVAGGTADVVQASVSFTLANDDFIETMQTTNATLTTAINLTGNALRQSITGNAGANILNGGIDAVADTLAGGLGNDIYIINTTADDIVELLGESTADRAQASVNFVLGIGDNIEFLETVDAAATTLINLTGNEFAQTITGNAGGNILNGGIDALVDVLVGGLGNDTYIINSTNDLITEFVGGGTADIVQASASFTLANDDFIETMQTTNAALTTVIDLTGNSIAQTIIGNAGANILNGMFGIDTLTGGLGSDIFLFNTTLGAANHDTITDFNVAADTIQLENAIFTLLTATGTLASALFKNLSLAAQDADDVILYNRPAGNLFVDTNGLAAGGVVLFADVTDGTALTFADFVVV